MKCFTVDYDQLNGILSPLFFISQPQDTKGFIPLNKIAFVNPNRPRPQVELDEKVPYVGLPETDEGAIKEVLYRPYKEVKGRNHFVKDDVLFARIEPSVFNQKYIYADDLKGNDYAFTSTEFYIVKAKEETDPKFIFYMLFTDQVFEQIKGKTTGSTGRRRLDKSAFEKTLIPYPDKETRAKVVEILEKAHKEREEKLKQADELLNSIDDFVRQQLGITYTEPEEEKIYTVNAQDLDGNRQDPYYYNPKFVEAFTNLSRLKHKTFSLGQLMVDMSGGATPRLGTDVYSDKDNGIPFLRVQNITEKGILLDDVKYIKRSVHEGELKRSQLKTNDLIFTITGRIGSVAVVPSNFIGNINQHSVRIQLKNSIEGLGINPTYVATFLNSSFGKVLTNRGITGGTRPALDYEYIKTIPIPIPAIEIQNTITNKFNKRLDLYEKLKNEAFGMLREAEKKVEEMILN